MELKLNRITAHVLTAGSYVVDLTCSFKRSSDGAVSPNHGSVSITLNKDQVEGLTFAEIEQVAVAEARRLFS